MQIKHLQPLSLGDPYGAYERQTLALVHVALDGGKPGMARHSGTEEDEVRQLLSSDPGKHNAGVDNPISPILKAIDDHLLPIIAPDFWHANHRIDGEFVEGGMGDIDFDEKVRWRIRGKINGGMPTDSVNMLQVKA